MYLKKLSLKSNQDQNRTQNRKNLNFQHPLQFSLFCSAERDKQGGKPFQTQRRVMSWVANQHSRRWWKTNSRFWAAAFLSSICFIFFFITPTIPRSSSHHNFVDMRNLLGIPNTLNVMTNFPFLVVGVLGFVLALEGGVFNISSQGEVLAWALFYAGIAGVAFGSAYYHLKPDDHRVLWDTLPMMIAFSSLLSSLVAERLGQRIGLCCMSALFVAAFLCVLYERIRNDIRFCLMFQLILPLAIPVISFMYRSRYTHSRYWFLSAGIYLLAKFEGFTDKKMYHVRNSSFKGISSNALWLYWFLVEIGVSNSLCAYLDTR